MTPITWTEAHRIEARRRCYEIAAVMAESLPDWQPGALIASYGSAESMRLVLRAMGCDPARIARELRRVDGLATGRLVRVVVWRGSRRSERTVEVANGAQVPPRSVVLEFEHLVKEWRDACRFLSSTTKRTAHPAFRRIVGMGHSVVPLLLAHLSEPGDWDLALAEIVGDNPVRTEAHGPNEIGRG